MAFFDEFGDKAKDLAVTAGEKAREVADKARITAAILATQREIDKNCRVIGEWFVSEYQGDTPEAIADVVEAVKAGRQRVAELQAAREKAPGEEEPVVDAGRACPLCGQVSNGKFCPHCGAPMGS